MDPFHTPKKPRTYMPNGNSAVQDGGGGGGCSNYFLTGCATRGLKPLPISKIFLPQKRLIFLFFSPRNFRKSGPISKGFSTSKIVDFTIFCNFCEMGPSSKDFLKSKWDSCLRNFAFLTHLGGTSPYALTMLTCEYPRTILCDTYRNDNSQHQNQGYYTKSKIKLSLEALFSSLFIITN